MTQKLLGGLGVAFVWILAPALCLAQDEPGKKGMDAVLTMLRKSKPAVAMEYERNLELAKRQVARHKQGHLVFGQIVVEGEKEPRGVVSQMAILEDGFFVGAIGFADKPIPFRLHGYEALNVIPEGPGPVEDLGIITMKPLPADRFASAKGVVEIESRKGAPRPEQIEVLWSISPEPVNTVDGGIQGSDGSFRRPVRSKVAADGTFSAARMTPAQYGLVVKAPNCVKQARMVNFIDGELNELEPIRLEVARKMNVDFVVAPQCDFANAKVAKAKLAANDRWRASEDVQRSGHDLDIHQKEGRLLLNATYSPCKIVDLGAAELADKLNVVPNFGPPRNWRNVPVEDGHVYLVEQGAFKHWILFRATLVESKDADEVAAEPSPAKLGPVNGQNNSPDAGSGKGKTAKAPMTESKKQDRIKALLAWAIANDDDEHGKAALDALDELLALDPKHAEGLRLQTKVRKYFPEK